MSGVMATRLGIVTIEPVGRRRHLDCTWCGRRFEVAAGREYPHGYCCRNCRPYERVWRLRKGIA